MRHPVWILNSALFLLFIIVLLFIFFSRVQIPAREDIEPAPYARPVAKKISEINIRKIYEYDLFDTYIRSIEPPKEPNYVAPLPPPPAARPVRVPPEPKPQFLAPLKISLKGIIVIEHDDNKSRAIIADTQTKREATYKVGDVIEDAQLIKIFNNKVLFLRSNGQQEVLYLRPKDAQQDPAYAILSGWKDVIRNIGDNNYLIDVNEFTFRIKNLAQFIDLLNLTTVYDQGKSIGCRVGALPENSLGAELGLVTGDIIVSVNGISATDTQHRLDIYKNIIGMKTKETIVVELLRNKAPLTFRYMLETKKGDRRATATQPAADPAISEQLNMLQERHTFAPTLREIRARERKTMLEKGQAPKINLTAPIHE